MSFLGLSSFGLAPEKRMDVANPDVEANVKAANTGDDSNDSSADVTDANGVTGAPQQPVFGGSSVSAPRVATATSKSVSVQHGAGASRVKP